MGMDSLVEIAEVEYALLDILSIGVCAIDLFRPISNRLDNLCAADWRVRLL